MNKKYDYLIVGSGLFGATFTYCAKQAGKRCLVIDKRPHVGGNVYSERINGINVHKYGPHIFHTKNQRVWEFVNRFVDFNRFTLCTIANYHGELYNLPFNMNTFHQMWGINTPSEALLKIESQRYHGPVNNLEQQALSLVGSDIYEILVKGYTEKQWGRACTELPSFIIRRLPVRLTYDNNYFNDPYQGIPIGGYNKLINMMLEGSDVITGIDFFSGMNHNWHTIAKHLVYTGKIDDYFNGCYGKLDYRSLRFETEILEEPNHQGVAIMNYTDTATPFTRIIEHKHFECFGDDVYDNPCTVVTKEFPASYEDGMEAFYPLNDNRNTVIYKQYQHLAQQENDVLFGGRLAEYAYYDMDTTVARALSLWEQHDVS